MLLAEPALRLLTNQDPSIKIGGVCSFGDGDPSGWLVLVDGAEMPTTRIRQTIKECARAAAIIWHADEVPTEAIVAAGTLALPLVQLPASMSRRRIHEIAQKISTQRQETSTWRRLTALSYFSKFLLSQRPEQDLVAKYQEMTQCDALLITMDGEIIANSGQLPVRTIIRSLRGHAATPQYFHVGRWLLSAIPLDNNETRWNCGIGYWLVVGRRDGNSVQPIRANDPVLGAAVQLLNVAIESRRQLSQVENFRASRVVSELVSGRGDPDELELQLLSRGFRKNAPLSVIVSGSNHSASQPGAAVEAITIAAQQQLPVIVAQLERRIILIVESRQSIRAIVDALPEPVGVSEAVEDIAVAPGAYRQARLAYWSAVSGGGAGESRRAYFHKTRPLLRALALLSREELDSCSVAVEEALNSISDGREFGLALVEESADLRKIARRCGIHVNTVRNRLSSLFDSGKIALGDVELWYYAHRLGSG